MTVGKDHPSPASSPANINGHSSASGQESSAILTTLPTAQAIKFLATQIPSFSGNEDDNVDLWLEKVERVAHIHGVTSEVILLAVSSKLTKTARDWFDLNTGTINVS